MIIQANACALPVSSGIVQCCVTSPPYWGLRDYGVAGQLGLESTPADYVANLVAVFREVRRALRDDGTLWLNLGDSYTSGGRDKWNAGDNHLGQHGVQHMMSRADTPASLKPKDLVGIPWRVAFALQADGWYLRSDIVWHKPNPMPSSVTDRPTVSHEYVFLLSKRERYYYDAAAIAEPLAASTLREIEQAYTGKGQKNYEAAGVQNPSDVKSRIVQKFRKTRPSDTKGGNQASGQMPISSGLTRNRRSVWTIPTQPYSGAHFATFPEKLVEPCILAGSKLGDLVLDPFAGSGTVGVVARRFNRRFIGIELNSNYITLARDRISGVQQRLEALS